MAAGRLWLPRLHDMPGAVLVSLKELGDRGPYHLDIRARPPRGPFDVEKTTAWKAWEPAVLSWANTTLGLVAFWWRGSRQQRGRARLSITSLPDLPVLDPESEIMESMAVLREQWCREPSVHGGKPTQPPQSRL